MSERLNEHRVRWRLRGLPIYDDDNFPIGITTEPEWRWSDLTADEQTDIGLEVGLLLTGRPDRPPSVPLHVG